LRACDSQRARNEPFVTVVRPFVSTGPVQLVDIALRLKVISSE
jgi:hypothetical protein